MSDIFELIRVPDPKMVEEMRSRLNVAQAVFNTRIAKGMTQDQLGRAAGTKQSRVSDLENMEGNPTLDTLDRVSRALGLEVALLPRRAVVGEPEHPPKEERRQ